MLAGQEPIGACANLHYMRKHIVVAFLFSHRLFVDWSRSSPELFIMKWMKTMQHLPSFISNNIKKLGAKFQNTVLNHLHFSEMPSLSQVTWPHERKCSLRSCYIFFFSFRHYYMCEKDDEAQKNQLFIIFILSLLYFGMPFKTRI